MMSEFERPRRVNPPPRVWSRPRRVGVVGGGIAGLVVAYRRMLAGDEVTLFESSGRLGGQLWTDVRDGFVVERGAEGFAAGSEAVRELARELGVLNELVNQRVHRAYGFDGDGLVLLETGEAPARLGLHAAPGRRGQGIASFRRGMGELTSALADKIRDRVSVRLNDPAWALIPSGSGWHLATGSLSRVRVDSVVLATGSRVAGQLVRQGTGESTGLEMASALSSVTVSLAYPRTSIAHALDASGFVVAEAIALDGCRACTFSSSKLHGRSPEGRALLRLFFRPSPHDLEIMSDRAWLDRAERVLRRALGVRGTPELGWVDRWPEALAVVDAEQQQRVAAVERRLCGRGIMLAGGAFHGPGIDAAVRSGEATSAALAALSCAS